MILAACGQCDTGVTPAMLPRRRHSGYAAVSRKLQPASQRGSVPRVLHAGGRRRLGKGPVVNGDASST